MDSESVSVTDVNVKDDCKENEDVDLNESEIKAWYCNNSFDLHREKVAEREDEPLPENVTCESQNGEHNSDNVGNNNRDRMFCDADVSWKKHDVFCECVNEQCHNCMTKTKENCMKIRKAKKRTFEPCGHFRKKVMNKNMKIKRDCDLFCAKMCKLGEIEGTNKFLKASKL